VNPPIINRGIAGRFLVCIAGLFIFMRLMMSMVHHFGVNQLVEKAADRMTAMVQDPRFELRDEDVKHFEKALQYEGIRLLIRETLISLALLGILIVVIFRLSRSITRPISELTHATRQMSRGDYAQSCTIPVHLRDEIGDLAESFKTLAANLDRARQDIGRKTDEIDAAEKRLNLFFDNALDMLAIENFEGKYLQINKAYAGALGYAPEELMGKSCVDLFHPDDLEASLEKLIDLKAGRSVRGFENRMRHKMGYYRRIGWNIASDPKAQRIYVIGWDVTEHRNTEQIMVRATAEEQERIARDLHNSVGQLLTGIAFKAKSLEHDLRQTGTADPEQAASLARLANSLIDETRTIARDIDPVELQHGLAASLEYLAHTSRDIFGIECLMDHHGVEYEIPRSKAVHLYWIAQEAVNNAIRLGNATKIVITLECGPKSLALTVQDNAVINAGINDTSDRQDRQIMKYRAQMIGGTLTFLNSGPGGRIVKCTVSFSDDLLYNVTISKEDRSIKEIRGAI